jgi:hypothetical protein
VNVVAQLIFDRGGDDESEVHQAASGGGHVRERQGHLHRDEVAAGENEREGGREQRL